MSEHLVVSGGETYTVGIGETEEWTRAEIDGTLDVQGTLKLIDDAQPPEEAPGPFTVPTDGIDLPLGIDLPTSPLNIRTMEMGLAMFLMGLLAVLLGAAAFLRNYAAGIMWGFAVVALLLSGLLGIGLELFWVVVITTALLLIMGMIVRWMA